MRAISLFTAAALTLSTGAVWAQGGFAGGFADPNSLNTLSAGGAAPAGGFATGRAQGAANTVNAQGGTLGGGGNPFGGGAPTGNPFGGGGQSFQGMPGGAPAGAFGAGGAGFAADPTGGQGFGAPAGGFAGAPGMGQQQAQQPQVQIPEFATVIYGERVVCRATGQILSDARELDVVAEFLNQYYDDGENGLDARAGDNTYTNATYRNDVISAEAHLVKTRVIRALEVAESLSPTEFFIVPVATTDLNSPFPRVLQLEEERDEKLRAWAERFLDDYRLDPEAVGTAGWEFVPTFLPPPPRTPAMDMPISFFPPSKAEEMEQEEQDGAGTGGRGGDFPGAGGGFGGGGGMPGGGGGRSGYM